MDKIYGEIAEELRGQYSLGYTPDRIGAGYHSIVLKTRNKGFAVQAREGYYGE